ncbi:uncharacterized protein B0H18DRAFT_959639 [Fomitopsis serialis]|uniref:uncharacterized protein n=1 Tax=Fomitopsis serialis TaxID=139415 RepID=UPI0020077A14|nr:uncharacterized protein B0H18DRAFT_959639 [Neoantrodia serialis]KAH9914725.1 hypothetical protein B0H18DRAFT_959639 [Neoantrodia serialis]
MLCPQGLAIKNGTETSTLVMVRPANPHRRWSGLCMIPLTLYHIQLIVGKEYWLQQLNNMFCKEALIQQPGRFCPPAGHFLAEHRLFLPAGEVEASAGQSKASAGDEKLRPMK